MDQSCSRPNGRRPGGVAPRTDGWRLGPAWVVAMGIALAALVLGVVAPAEATEPNAPMPVPSTVGAVADAATVAQATTPVAAGVDGTIPGSANYPLQVTFTFDVGAGVRVRIYAGDSNCMGAFPTNDFVTHDAVTVVPLVMAVRSDSLACVFEPSLQQVRIDVTGGATEVHNSLNFVQMLSTGLPNWKVICGSTTDCSISRPVPLTLIWESRITAKPPQPATSLGIDCVVAPAKLLSRYHQPCGATGGTPGIPSALTIVGGRLPNGLELSQGSAGSFPGIVGTPQEKGSFPITLRAHNGVQADATLDVTVVVDAALTVTTLVVAGSSPYRSCVFPAEPGPTCGALFTLRTYSLEGRLDAPTTWSVRRPAGLLDAGEYTFATGPPVTTLLEAGVSEVTTTVSLSSMSPGSYEAEAVYPGGAATEPSSSGRVPFSWVRDSAPLALALPDPGSAAALPAAATPISATPAFTG